LPVSDFSGAVRNISMQPDELEIEEVIVTNIPIEKTIEKIINTSKARFNKPIVLNTYYREFVKQNGKYTKFSDGLLDYHTTGTTKKTKTDLIVRESRAARIAMENEDFDPDSFLDVRERITRNYDFTYLSAILLKGKNYKYYDITLKSKKNAAGKEMYVIGFNPKADVEKPLFSGSVVYDPASNLIYDIVVASAQSHMKYAFTMSLFGFKISFLEQSMKASYRMQGNNYVAFYNKASVAIKIFNRRRGLDDLIESKYDLVVNNYSSGSPYDKSKVYKEKSLYGRGNHYSAPFWKNSNAMVLTDEEENVIKNLEKESAEAPAPAATN
jgi:hypothetical protein